MARWSRWVTSALLGAALLGSVLLMAVGSRVAGIGWDSVFDSSASLAARAVPPDASLEQAYELVPMTSEFYGTFLYQAADLAHRMVTGSTTLLQPLDASTYGWQAAVNVVLAVVATIAVGISTWLAFGSVVAALFTAALLASTPLWLGMAFVDLKDLPVAAGLTLISFGVTAIWARPRAWPWLLAAVTAVCVGSVVALSTRGGAAVPVALVLGASIAAWLAYAGNWRRAANWAVAVGAVVIPLAVTVVFVILTNPVAGKGFVRWVLDSLAVSHAYPWSGLIRTAGQDLLSTDLPWWYVPAWVVAQVPLLTWLVVVPGVLAVVAALARRATSPTWQQMARLTPYLVQGFALPLIVVASRPVLYDGIRHLLFIVPALAVLGGAGFASLEARTASVPWRQAGVMAMGVAVVWASLWAAFRWFPYSYAFVNPAAAAAAGDRGWELDYWGVSGREGVERLSQLGFSEVAVVPEPTVGAPFGGRSLKEVQRGAASTEPFGVYEFRRYPSQIPASCVTLFTIERDGQLVGQGASCAEP